MKKLRFFDSLKFVVAAIVCTLILNVAYAATLPAGYTELEYIKSTGTQYIDTGVIAKSSIKAEFMVDRPTPPANGAPTWQPLSSKNDPTNGQFAIFESTNGAGYKYIALTYGKVTTSTVITESESWVSSAFNQSKFVLDGGVLSVDNNSHIITSLQAGQTFNSGNTLRLFMREETSSSESCTMYYMKLWDGNTLVRDLIPCKNASNVVGMYDLVSGQFFTNAGTGTFIAGEYPIKIATTKYNEESFAPVQTDLSAAVNAVEYVVSNTMTQAQAIDQIANEKQTRPDESCPPFKKCLLVEDEDGTPHWYEIYDPINDFLNPILAAAALSGNQGAPIMTTHTENGSTLYDTFNGFYNGSGAFRKKYIDNAASVSDRPFGPTTLPRCADDATRTTSTVNAGLCYNTGGMFRTLTEGADDDSGEWALVWNGNEGGASLGITPGVVYGIAKCTTVGQHATEMTGDVQSGSEYWWPKKLTGYSGGGTTLASLISEYPNSNVETVFNTLPNPYGTDDNPEYPRANYRNCWCKMTEIGVGGSGDTFAEQAANGTIMSVSGGWVLVQRLHVCDELCGLLCVLLCVPRPGVRRVPACGFGGWRKLIKLVKIPTVF